MTFDEYVINKVSVTLNLWYSKGSKSSGVISDNVINKLASKVDNFGKYYIVTSMSFPVDLIATDVPPSGSIVISFTPDEFRNKQLVSILK
jgi:hypothetical protein